MYDLDDMQRWFFIALIASMLVIMAGILSDVYGEPVPTQLNERIEHVEH